MLLAPHFQYQVEILFKVILIDGPPGKMKHNAIKVWFQVFESPHFHLFLWIIDSQVLCNNNIYEYTKLIDSVTKVFVEDLNKKPELHLVTTYQVHSRSNSCQKYKNEIWSYHLGKCFTDNTMVSASLQDNLPEQQKYLFSVNENRYYQRLSTMLLYW